MRAWIVVFLLVCIATTGCRTKIHYVERKTETRDSINLRDSVVIKESVVLRDSVSIRDSVVIVLNEKGEVVRTEKYRDTERLRDLNRDFELLKEKYDSLSKEKTQSVPIPYPVHTVSNQLNWWQKTLCWTGAVTLMLGIAFVVYKLKN